MTNWLLLLLLGVPTGGAVVAGVVRVRATAALAVTASTAVATAVAALLGAGAVAAGAAPSLGPVAAPWLALDAGGALLAVVASLVAATVTGFARRNLAGDSRAGWFGAAASGLLAATLLLATATTLWVATVSWVLASVATVVLCGYRGDPAGRGAARSAIAALAPGDAALVLAVAVATAAAGPVRLGDLGDSLSGLTLVGPVGVPLAPLVMVLVVVAVLGRAGQLPFRPWMTATVDAPTPVSALLHAGSVNAGGFLLVRTSDALWSAPTARITLAVLAGSTMAVAAAATVTRADVKGRLATSTAAQMGVMLLAAAVGAPGAVLTHLAGHSLYKSARFLGAGGAVRARVAARRAARARPALVGPSRSVLAAGAAVVAVVAWLAVATSLAVPAPERAVTAGLLGAVVAAGAWTAGLAGGRRGFVALSVAVAAGAGLATAAVTADRLLGLPHPGGTSAAVAAGAMAAAVAAVAVAVHSPALTAVATRWATAPVTPPPLARRRHRRVDAGIPVVVEVGRSW